MATKRGAMRRLAITGVVTVAAALSFLGGTGTVAPLKGRGATPMAAARGRSKIAGFRPLKCAALRSRATADPAHQIRIGRAIRSRNDASHNRLVCTPGRGANEIDLSADYFAGCGSHALPASSARDAKPVAKLRSKRTPSPHPVRRGEGVLFCR